MPSRRQVLCDEKDDLVEIEEILEFNGKLKEGVRYELRMLALSEKNLQGENFKTLESLENITLYLQTVLIDL